MSISIKDKYTNALLRCQEINLGDIMCDGLKRLNGKSAEDILKASGQEEMVPVNLDAIIRTAKIIKIPHTFDDLERETGKEVAGLVLLHEHDVAIFYDKNASITRKRFIIAHEIGHCCLHGDMLKDGYIEYLKHDGFEDDHETEASAYAARILIPEQSLIMIYNKLILPSLSGLADIFQVPKKIMEYRLKELKLRYYLDERATFIEP